MWHFKIILTLKQLGVILFSFFDTYGERISEKDIDMFLKSLSSREYRFEL